MTKLQSDHSSILLQSQSNYNKCQTSLLEETQSHVKTMTKLRMQADQNERVYQHSVQKYLDESIQTYNITNEALVMVSTHYKEEVEKYESIINNSQSSLTECQQSLENNMVGVEQYESMIKDTQNSLTKCKEHLEIGNRQYNNCRVVLEDKMKEDADRTDECQVRDDELQSLRTEVEKYESIINNSQSSLAECQQSLDNMVGVEQYESMIKDTQNSLTKCKEHLEIGNRQYMSCSATLEDKMREDADRTEEYQARDDELQSLRTEVEKYDLMMKNTQSSLSECQQSLEENMVGVEHYESMMNHTQSSLTKCRIQLESMIKEDADRTEEYKVKDDELQSLRRELELAEEELERRDNDRTDEYKAKDDELQSLRRELELAEEELERRDIERAECDKLYRDLTKARVQNKGE